MATAKLTVKVPPIVSIEARGDHHYGQPASFEEQPNARIFGVFSQVNAEGRLVGALEIGGNIAPFHTCCGGMRVSALRVDYRTFDTWYPASSYVATNTISRQQQWVFLRDNLSAFPTVSDAAMVDASRWTREKLYAWGRATLCAHVKAEMNSWRRTTLIALDRTNGHTVNALSYMKHIDNVYYRASIRGQPFAIDGHRKAESNYPFRSHTSSWRSYLTGYWGNEGDFQKLRAYGTALTRNINSGNMLIPVTVCPQMSASLKKSSGAKLVRSPSTHGLEFTQYTTETECDHILRFYTSMLFANVCPSVMTHA